MHLNVCYFHTSTKCKSMLLYAIYSLIPEDGSSSLKSCVLFFLMIDSHRVKTSGRNKRRVDSVSTTCEVRETPVLLPARGSGTPGRSSRLLHAGTIHQYCPKTACVYLSSPALSTKDTRGARICALHTASRRSLSAGCSPFPCEILCLCLSLHGTGRALCTAWPV